MDQATGQSVLRRGPQTQDGAGWDRFWSIYQPLLWEYVCHFGLSDSDAQDLEQDIYGKLRALLPRPDAAWCIGWLRGTTDNHIRHWLSSRQRAYGHVPRMAEYLLAAQEAFSDAPDVEERRIEAWRKLLLELAVDRAQEEFRANTSVWNSFQQIMAGEDADCCVHDVHPVMRWIGSLCRELDEDVGENAAQIGLLRQAAAHLQRPRAQPRSSPLAGIRPFVPERIGRYTVIGVLDRGGRADVYRVMHPELRREVVLKLGRRIRPENSAARQRLLKDGEQVALIEHPALARVYEVGIHEDRAFLVSERTSGRTLAELSADRPMSTSDSVRLVRRIAMALRPVHRHLLVHGQISPETIVADERGQPFLADLGTGLICGADRNADSNRDEFIAPEQWAGHTGLITPRTDVFALGAVLKHLLMSGPLSQMKLGSALPRGLLIIVDTAMQADPARRYADARELAEALRRWQTAERARRAVVVLVILLSILLTVLCAMWLLIE